MCIRDSSNSGVITALSGGTATITATAKDGSGKSASCSVNVKQFVSSITLNKTSEAIYTNAKLNLTATVNPNDATDKSLTWSCSNLNVASVSSTGEVTGLSAGTATITATANDGSGVSASCEVNVMPLANILYALTQKVSLGRKVTFPIYMNNDVSICGYEFYLQLPEGITVDYSYDEEEEEYVYGATNGERARTSHVISCSKRQDGTYYFFCYDPSNRNFYDSDDRKDLPVLYVTLNVADDIEVGQYDFTLKGMILNHNNESNIIEEYKPLDFSNKLNVVKLHAINTAVNDASFGSVAVSGQTYDADGNCAEDGDELTLTATPADKYRFVEWTEGGVSLSTDNPLVIILTGDRDITAVFERSQSNVTFMVDGETYSAGFQNCGDAITLPEEPAKKGYVFLYWDGIGTDGLVPEDDVTYTAVFTMLGDIHEDSKVNITDLTSLVNYLKSGTTPNDIRTMKAADLTKDGKLNITDLTSLVNIMKSGLMMSARPKKSSSSFDIAELGIDDKTASASREFDMGIVLKNGNDKIANMQFDIILPEGISFANSKNDMGICLESRAQTHSLAVGHPEDNVSRVILYSADNCDIDGTDGKIITLKLVAEDKCIGRRNEILIKDIILSRSDETSMECSSISAMVNVANATGIEGISSDSSAMDIFDIHGIRHDNVRKNSINIINGKKILIK